MKKLWLMTALLGVVAALTASAHAEEVFITSDQLTIEDVRGTIINEIKSMDKNGSLKEIYGIHQDSPKHMDVFWSAVIKGQVQQSYSTIVRFISGKWFNTDLGEVLKKAVSKKD